MGVCVAADRDKAAGRLRVTGSGEGVFDDSKPSNCLPSGITSIAATHPTIETSRLARAILLPDDKFSIGA
jgi:hypothetical protein